MHSGVRIGGHTYTDPDVIALIHSRGVLVDPRVEIVRRARQLNERYRAFEGTDAEPRRRLEMIASLAGITTVEPMFQATGSGGRREGLVYHDSDGSQRAFYANGYSDGRTNYTIAHEIIHTQIPTSSRGARFRNLSAADSREANEMERLCDWGAAELLMPSEEFVEALGGDFGLHAVPALAARFGSSYEATVFRLATTYHGLAIAGSLRFRLRKREQEAHACSHQQRLFSTDPDSVTPVQPKYRRQSLHLSLECSESHLIPWNKSFDVSSCVYRAGRSQGIQTGREALPNRAKLIGTIQAVRAPYQRGDIDSDYGDVLFIWWL
ncbi:MAG: ImmA/IrrE family metallo-endopeptidase [Bryobacteraceae bacterium]|nr:ImmA/IrrE family metallo-endopeptidase [Bryobacteraceae bacterium]